jgi:hypothetical protein
MDNDLYYVIDILPDASQYLLEDCKTLDLKWMDVEECDLRGKEVSSC